MKIRWGFRDFEDFGDGDKNHDKIKLFKILIKLVYHDFYLRLQNS